MFSINMHQLHVWQSLVSPIIMPQEDASIRAEDVLPVDILNGSFAGESPVRLPFCCLLAN